MRLDGLRTSGSSTNVFSRQENLENLGFELKQVTESVQDAEVVLIGQMPMQRPDYF